MMHLSGACTSTAAAKETHLSAGRYETGRVSDPGLECCPSEYVLVVLGGPSLDDLALRLFTPALRAHRGDCDVVIGLILACAGYC